MCCLKRVVAFVVRRDRCASLRRAVTPDIFIVFVVCLLLFNGDFWGSDSLQFKEETMMLRTSLSSSSSVLPSPSLPLRRRKSKSRGVFVNSSTSRDNRYETSFPSSSASGVRGVAANSFPRDDDDDDVEEVVHTVAPGDSLYGVAIAYDVDPRDLIVSNRSSRYRSSISSSSKRKSYISFVFEFLIQKYATSSIEKNKM